MKKITAIILTAIILLSVMVLPSFAYTKAELLEAASEIRIYKYIKSAVENSARNIIVTEEQSVQLMPLIQEAKTIFAGTDNGPTNYHPIGGEVYTVAQRKATFSIIDRACAIMGWHYTWGPADIKLHEGDVVFYLYDKDNQLIFQYDGDILLYMTDTSGSEYSTTTAVLLIAAGAVSTVAACTIALFKRKKTEDEI